MTYERANNIDPVWTPDGKRIVFKGLGNRLYWQQADGSGPAEALTNDKLSTNNVDPLGHRMEVHTNDCTF